MHSTITLIRRIFVTLTLLVGFVGLATAQDTSPTCNGKFMNPITDVCWSCVFPIKISGVNFFPGGQEDNGSTSSRIFCACGNNGVIKAGVPISFWEPARTVEVVRGPIAAAVLGGTSMSGGRGRIGGTIVGAFVIGVLSDGLVMMGVSAFWQTVIKGLVIVAAVVVDQAQQKLQARVALQAQAALGK